MEKSVNKIYENDLNKKRPLFLVDLSGKTNKSTGNKIMNKFSYNSNAI